MVPVEESLATTYRPDREYVAGQLIERNVGTHRHSFLQGLVFFTLKTLGLRAYAGLRLQIAQNRFRLPDVLALAPGQKFEGEYLTEAPCVVAEILSSDDRINDLNEKPDDYFRRVPNIWVVDLNKRTFTIHEPIGSRTIRKRVELPDHPGSIDIADLFRQMDEDEA